MDKKAFSPTGKTILVVAATTAPTGQQCPENGTVQGIQYRVHNAGSVTAYLSFGKTSAEAIASAVIPSGTSQECFPLPAGIVEVLSFPVGSFFTGITVSSTANVFITPGKGI